MKRRKRWTIGLLIVFLAACVGVWNWSERPPYGFMAGSRLNSVQINAGRCQLDYVSDRTVSELLWAAKRELAILDWQPGGIPERWMGYGSGVTIAIQGVTSSIRRSQDRLSKAGVEPAIPESAKSVIQIYRDPSFSDRLRAWNYSFRWSR